MVDSTRSEPDSSKPTSTTITGRLLAVEVTATEGATEVAMEGATGRVTGAMVAVLSWMASTDDQDKDRNASFWSPIFCKRTKPKSASCNTKVVKHHARLTNVCFV